MEPLSSSRNGSKVNEQEEEIDRGGLMYSLIESQAIDGKRLGKRAYALAVDR